ncbi:hypothetical protein FisN_2Lh177 [Fistulifera solaris]|uniref:Pirin N-terminal domain-containing protein n=1 Tax=Fistulifera solaris TaxID=1519565 RepID=A0A1Z5KFC2_FISSO|nr:hypothetical protein FisN_2Lh177 [Fistulifera solaris]|eukprot:GAX24906.1 hypothetical protein FisN_2Lh177 [Fistulifera solaris]
MKFASLLLSIWLTEADAFTTTSFRSHRPSSHAMAEQRAEHIVETRAESRIRAQVLTSRPVARVETFARLPVWPVVNGVVLWMIQQLFGTATAAAWEHRITGRVCPNFFVYQETSPFVMLVHHCHSFAAWDPIRYLQATFFPEGFPAHPHRGFVTVTYMLDGGFVHRDSVGVRQMYGNALQSGNHGVLTDTEHKHTQWLHTGSGMLHEEMFDNKIRSWWKPTRQELYQLWLNVPISDKMNEPMTVLLGGPVETPLVQDTTSRTLVLAGNFAGTIAAAPIHSPLCILHVQIEPGGTWIYKNEEQHFETALLYVRKGNGLACAETPISVHSVAYFAQGIQGRIVLQNTDRHTMVDFLFLAGDPLREPCVSSGSMVMSNSLEINQAYSDYQKGMLGVPWSHKLSDDEWKTHIQANPKRTNLFR